jgi:hypothetical protein
MHRRQQVNRIEIQSTQMLHTLAGISAMRVEIAQL